APSAREPEIPGREGGAPLAQPIPTASVPLANGSDVVRRGGSAPSLELASAAGEMSRAPRGQASPSRGARLATSHRPGAPGSSAGIAAPSERADGAPARIDSVNAPFGGIVGARSVAVEAPAAPPATKGGSGGGGSEGFSIDGLAGGGGSGTRGRASAG